jgi:hypothetical protein
METETKSNSTETQWYYVQAGRKIGPVTLRSLLYLFQHQSMSPNTLVWNPEMTDWQPANQTSLAGEIHATKSPIPPPGTLPRYAVIPEPFGEVRFYYISDGQEKGPVSCKKLYDLLLNDKIPPHTPIRRSGQTKLIQAQEVFDLSCKIPPEPPELPTFWAAKTKEVPDFKKTPVILVIFLTFITLGLYHPIWYIKRRKAINSLQSTVKLKSSILIVALLISIINLIVGLTAGILDGFAIELHRPDFHEIAEHLNSASDWSDLIMIGISIFLVFTVRRILKDHYNQHLGQNVAFSWLATLLFQFYYLQYKINRLVY